MITCKQCDTRKAEKHFSVAEDGTRMDVCKKCMAGDANAMPKRKYRRKAEPEPVDAGLVNGPALSIAPGLGLDAWIENGCLQLAQGEDVVALSQTEAKVLFAQFGEWAA